ncbi:MAG: diacylglycerol/lipid kinase family protein [Chthoniobacterales bacterium]
MKRGLLIFNEKAGAQNRDIFPAIHATLGDVAMVSFEELGKPERAYACARELGCEWIAVAGGDGTIGAIAGSLVGSDLPLGLIPVGTYNNFARSLHVPLDPIAACRRILAQELRSVDVGLANGKPFFECLGVGLDAAIFPAGEAIKSGGFQRWFELLQLGFQYPRHDFTMTFDRPVQEALCHNTANESRRLVRRIAGFRDRTISLSALMVTVSNGPYYGMNFAVAPDERMDDGLFTVSVFHRFSKWQLASHYRSISQGRREYSPKGIAFRVAHLTLTSHDNAPVHYDGTVAGQLPLDIECRPGALKVY